MRRALPGSFAYAKSSRPIADRAIGSRSAEFAVYRKFQ